MVIASLILGASSLVSLANDPAKDLLVLHYSDVSGVSLTSYSICQTARRAPEYAFIFWLPELRNIAEAVYDKSTHKIAVLGIDHTAQWNWYLGAQGSHFCEKIKSPPESRIVSVTFEEGQPLFFFERRPLKGPSQLPLFEARIWKDHHWTKALLSMPFDKPYKNRYTRYPELAQKAIDLVKHNNIELYPVRESMGVLSWSRLFGYNSGSTLGSIDVKTGDAVVQMPPNQNYVYLAVIKPNGKTSFIRLPAMGTVSQLRIKNNRIYVQWSRGLAEVLTTDGKQLDIVRSILIVDIA